MTLLDYKKVAIAARKLRALDNPIRKGIMTLISENENMSVTDIYVKMRMEQSQVSQHLSILRRSGYIHSEGRIGQVRRYHIDTDEIERVAEIASKLSKFYDPETPKPYNLVYRPKPKKRKTGTWTIEKGREQKKIINN